MMLHKASFTYQSDVIGIDAFYVCRCFQMEELPDFAFTGRWSGIGQMFILTRCDIMFANYQHDLT